MRVLPFELIGVKRTTHINWFRCKDARGLFYVKQRTSDLTRWECERCKRAACLHVAGVALEQHTIPVLPWGSEAMERAS